MIDNIDNINENVESKENDSSNETNSNSIVQDTTEILNNNDNLDTTKNETKEEIILETISDDDDEMIEMEERISDFNKQNDLSNTQINFINASSNSYIDEKGRPQLNITQEFDTEKLEEIKEADLHIYSEEKTAKEKQEIINQKTEKIEVEYDPFKYDKITSIFTTLVIIFLILALLSVGYLVLTTFII